jgi:tight adherence protein B
MPGDLSLAVVGGIFILSVAVVIGLGLFVISVVLDAQHKHRRRLMRVGRRRMTGRLDLDEARIMLLRQKQETNALVSISDALARFMPLLDTTRLRANIRRAGMRLSVGGFILISLAVAAALAVGGSAASGYPLPLIVVPALLAGMFLVDRFVKLRGEMRSNRFMKQMADAIDTIIRGIRAGLPVIECIGTVGKEFDDPIGGHFRAISERVALGEPLDAALWRVAQVIDRPEMDFLAVSISIQMETGGSLAEALGNLADLLRQRQRMKLKIKAISSEAKASALIIGVLPFLMLGLLTMMSPDYVMPLFTDPRGQKMLAGGGLSIAIGGFVMWRMTQFEI